MVGLLSVSASAKIYCQSKIKGKYVTPKNFKGRNAADVNACLTLCEEDHNQLLQSEDGPFQTECHKRVGRKYTLLETFGDALPQRQDCETFWHNSNDRYKFTTLQTESMCRDHFRVNTLYALQTKYYIDGFSVDQFFKGKYLFTRTDYPLCVSEIKGIDVTSNPKFTTKKYSEEQCLNRCEETYERSLQNANGETRMVNCYYGRKKIKVFGDLGEKKSCITINADTEKIEFEKKFETPSLCKSDFRKNRINLMNKKYKDRLFHVNLVFDNELIRDFYHKVRCEFRAKGIQPRDIKTSRMVTGKDECQNFCQERLDHYVSRADGEPRWGTCYLGSKKIADLGKGVGRNYHTKIIDRGTGELAYRKFLAKTRSIANYYFRSYRQDAMRKINEDGEFHWDIIFKDELLTTYDRFGICRVKYEVGGRTRGTQKKEIEATEDCQGMCQKTMSILKKNFPDKEIKLSCKHKGSEIKY